MLSQLRPAVVMTMALTVVTGILYPFAVTGVANIIFPDRATGSLLTRNGTVIGSSLIGQSFAAARYFHGRPSAAGANGYDAMASGGSNLGPIDQRLIERVQAVAKALHEENPAAPIPVDLVTVSGSGLDPHITPAAAHFQVPRVARERGASDAQIQALVGRYTQGRQLGVLGEPRVNVLELNLALDAMGAQ